MAVEKVYLDPNAAAYSNDEIIGKINSGAIAIVRANVVEATALKEDTTFKKLTSGSQAKLAGVEEGATTDQSGTEIRDAVVALADADRKILISRPTSGQKVIYAVQTHWDGKQEIEQSDTAES